MDIISNNPFRVAGIYANSKEKEFQKNKAKINAYTKVGKEVSFDVDFPFLENLSRNGDNGYLEKSFANLQQYKDRVYHGLFWFINLTSIDSTALNYLRNGDKHKALEIWSKVVDGKDVNSKNYSSFNNQGTLLLMGDSLDEIKQGVYFKIQLIQSNYFEDFVHAVSDKTYSIESSELLSSFVEECLNQLGKNGFSQNELLSVFNTHNEAENIAQKKLIATPLYNIETLTESTKAKRKQNKKSGLKLGRTLLNETAKDLNFLEKTLGNENLKYKYAADNLAKEILQCGVDYFKYWQEENDEKVGKDVLNLFQDAKLIAVGSQAQERIDDNIEGIKEWIENAPDRASQQQVKEELKFINNKLREFQNKKETTENADTLLNECLPKLELIRKKLGSQNQLYLNLSTTVASITLGMIVAVVNKAMERRNNYVKYLNGEDYQNIEDSMHTTLQVINGKVHRHSVPTEYSITRLKRVVQIVWEKTGKIGNMAMMPKQKSHFDKNYKGLKRIVEQLGISTSHNRPNKYKKANDNNWSRTTGSQTQNTSNETEKTPTWIKWIIAIVVGLIIIGGIWGEEGLEVMGIIVMMIIFFGGISFLMDWLRRL